MKVDIDVEMAREQLQIQRKFEKRVHSIDDLARLIADYYRIALGDIKGKSRKKEVVLARHLSMYLAHKTLKKTLEEIGLYFENRDNSTVIHGIKKLQSILKDNPKLHEEIVEIESHLIV